ncbi:predicted protein [Nematostella vectensis]|uniref:SAM domain-containing protein n=1 Tax=Nematostella vectensis TaxID=45351 RepID=A7RYJ4_NEMVE|nr:predicted protein [Nematostella vectensis]|eukprot:XP_001635595.1 predicted protein [Nematostella vectensis]
MAPTPVPRPSDTNPPPLPAKRFKPKSVEELLKRIGYHHYLDVLQDNGYDQISFLKEITDEDLINTRIPAHEHSKGCRIDKIVQRNVKMMRTRIGIKVYVFSIIAYTCNKVV